MFTSIVKIILMGAYVSHEVSTEMQKYHNSGPLHGNWLVIYGFCTIFHGESDGNVRTAHIEKYETRKNRVSG